MRSDLIKEGPSRAPHRSLLRALGIDDLEMKPLLQLHSKAPLRFLPL